MKILKPIFIITAEKKADDPESMFTSLSEKEIEEVVIPKIKMEIFIGSHE